jgi:hypothetical protein
MSENKVSFWRTQAKKLIKDPEVLIELEYGDVHNRSVGHLREVTETGIIFQPLGTVDEYATLVAYDNIDRMARLPFTATPTAKGKAAGKGP